MKPIKCDDSTDGVANCIECEEDSSTHQAKCLKCAQGFILN